MCFCQTVSVYLWMYLSVYICVDACMCWCGCGFWSYFGILRMAGVVHEQANGGPSCC